MYIIKTHDMSVTGIRYKLVVNLGNKKQKDWGNTVLDLSNKLHREFGFKYAYYPSIDKIGKTWYASYFFNDPVHANMLCRLVKREEIERFEKIMMREILKLKKEGYPCADSKYFRE